MARRDEAKKRRRVKRLLNRNRSERSFDNFNDRPDPENAFGFLTDLKRLLSLREPARWPGFRDPSLARPDMAKLDFAEWTSTREPGKSKLKQLEEGFGKGVLGYLPNIEHWAIEEFLWHGLPGDRWHPIDAYLAATGDRFAPAAHEQLRLWKEAKLSVFEIGEVRDDLAELRAWDPYVHMPSGPWLRTIALNIGGVNFYRQSPGRITLTYVAPWAPQEEFYCAMGYGAVVLKQEVNGLLPYLGLQHPEILRRAMPWKVSRNAENDYLRVWRSREWHSWLMERLQFPFQALILLPRAKSPTLRTVVGLLPSTATQAHTFGIYFEVPLDDGEVGVIGATGLTPLDVTTPNLAALREYSAYRERVGPPPGTMGRGRLN
jgi:hypothetical protein